MNKAARHTIVPRLIRMRDAPAYCGMDREKFEKEIRPQLLEISRGPKWVAFDRVELDAVLDKYVERNGRRPKAQPEDDKCQNETGCRGSVRKAGSGISKRGANTASPDGSGKAQGLLAALRQKAT